MYWTSGLFGIGFLIFAVHRRREALTLDHFVTLDDDELPGLSIVVAAKDEAKTIGPALDSLLNIDYPDLEIILVDDRSTDQTYDIILERSAQHPNGNRLRIIRSLELRQGWLGKIHALHLGAKQTTKPLVLFTDADVIFEQGSLRRAVSAQQILDCDHLVVAPQILTRGFWEPVLVALFLILFALRFQPNRVHKRKKSYVGIGAFNLLTRSTLLACKELEPLRLQVIDDVHLGRLVKSLGRTQYCLVAEQKIKVRWFEGLRGCVLGLEKNAYAGLNYSLPFSLLVITCIFIPALLPFALCGMGQVKLAAAYLGFQGLLGMTIPDSCNLPKWVGFFFPLAGIVLGLTFARSVWLTEKQNGVVWRDTHYPLSDLREHHKWFRDEAAPL